MALFHLLGFPKVYDLIEAVLGSSRCTRIFLQEYVRARPSDRILDVGCGTAKILERLPTDDYVGIDAEERYIRHARARYGGRGSFRCVQAGREAIESCSPAFDIVLAVGVVHHLDDSEAAEMFQGVRAVLKPGGRLVTLDPCFVPGQSLLARWLIRMDRGFHPRDAAAYRALASAVFPEVRSAVRHDMLNIPYSEIVLECR